MKFEDRSAAGRALAGALSQHAGRGAIVVGLPRGGVVVADEVARALDAPLDVWVVRKLGVPFQPELGMGAIAEGPSLVLDRNLIAQAGVTSRQVMQVVRTQADEIRRRVVRFREGRAAPDVRGRTVIVVDDGIATGGTARAALRGLRKRGAGYLVLATPVASPEVLAALKPEADDVVCLYTPRDLWAIGMHYRDFDQVTDEEVVRILERSRTARARPLQSAPV